MYWHSLNSLASATDTSLASHLDEIDAVDKSVQSLEETIAALDKYTKQLEIAANKAVADAAQ